MQSLKNVSLLRAAVLLLISSSLFAEEDLPIPADEFVYCTVCHGVQLMGNSVIRAPRLSEMESWYVEKQLRSFKKGWRGTHEADEADEAGFEMQPMAAALSDEQIDEVASFVTMTRSAAPAGTVHGDIDRGKNYYATCAACHGADGQGDEALGGPALTATNDWYLVTQLQNYKNGSRGAHPDDSSGNQMRAAAQILTDDDAIKDVVSYITTLRINQE